MTLYNELYEITVDNHYLVTTKDAAALPDYMCVAVPTRTRKSLPARIRLCKADARDEITSYDGVSCQSVDCAIRSARPVMMTYRLKDAARSAREQGYLIKRACKSLEEELGR